MAEPQQESLAGIRILDLTRVLAGPGATQLLGDLGADVIKVERPGTGDDTRAWGPPFLRDGGGGETSESAYYLATNRNKRSITIDLDSPEGQRLVRALAGHCDVLVENFKVGAMARFGLTYENLRNDHPGLIFCSISAYGQTGPYAKWPGYDFLIQAMGGLMSITGAPEGEPMKVGVAVTDVVCGLYAAIAILAALRHRECSGEGQFIDIGLLDTQLAWLVNQAMNYLISGEVPQRLGNAHPNIVPYQVFPACDGYFVIAVGNDAQFRRLCMAIGLDALAEDPDFATNAARVRNRDRLIPLIAAQTERREGAVWLATLQKNNVPCGPVNTLDQVFADPQVIHRGMRMAMPHPLAGAAGVPMVASPLRLSATPARYRRPPPLLGEHTDAVLEEVLGLGAPERARLRAAGVI